MGPLGAKPVSGRVGLDPGAVVPREGLFLDGFDVALHRLGDLEIMVDNRVRDGMHHRERAQPHVLGIGIHSFAYVREPTVVAMPDRHDEIAVDEYHDLAGLDDLTSQQGGLVWHVVEGLEHQEQ